jgi:hypothetical protein
MNNILDIDLNSTITNKLLLLLLIYVNIFDIKGINLKIDIKSDNDVIDIIKLNKNKIIKCIFVIFNFDIKYNKNNINAE